MLLRLRGTLLKEHLEHSTAAVAPHETGSDQADIANDETEHERLLAELAHEEAQLTEIDAALKRLRDGSYGTCELTGKPIAPERLRALPWTRLSHEAAAGLEGKSQSRPRK